MQEAPFSVTFVQGKPAMITVRAETAEGWAANMDAAASSGALTKVKQITDSLNGVRPELVPAPAEPGPSENWQSTQQAAQKSSQELPGGFANPSCVECGGSTRFDKEGVSQKSGKPYKRYICTINTTHRATFTD